MLNLPLLRAFLLPWLIAAFLSGCAVSRYEETAALQEYREVLVSGMSYDETGLPAPGTALSARPSSPGEHFTVVSLAGPRLLTSCDIAVGAGRPDFGKPFRVVYEWTGKGFEVGMQATMVMTHGLHGTFSGPDALAALAFVFTPVAIGGVTGFVIGIGDGVVQTALELYKFVPGSNEQVLTCTLYEYDTLGRLRVTRMLSPDGKQELVRTTFEYQGAGKEPARTAVESFIEGRQRVVR